MPSTKHESKKPASSGSGKPSKSGELKAGDLDKVTGGMKPIGGVKAAKPTTFSGDPCEGGE